MYLEHFGLQRPPFKITPDTSMFYSGNKRGAALEALKYAIASGEGIVKVVGEVGTGKTMLCRMLEMELGNDIEVVYIANPSLSPDNILHVIAFELNLNITPTSSKLEVMQALQNYLLEKHADSKRVVVFVEEAQSMPIETLEEIRLLSNLETNNDKLLQMVLFGQPELDEKLRNNSIRQLKERITQNFYLDPFPAHDVFNYLNFRMRAVGYKGPDIFSLKMANSIEQKSNGLTRRINILADKSLLAAFSDGGHDITSKHINLAAKDSDFGQGINIILPLKILLSVSIIFLAIWIGTLLPTTNINNSKPLIDLSPSIVIESKQSNFNDSENLNYTKYTAEIINIETLNQLLSKTQDWLIQSQDNQLTIQLILLDSYPNNIALNFLRKYSTSLDLNKIYIYKVNVRGSLFYSVLYNRYNNQSQALQQLQQLTPSLRKSGPYLRSIKAIKADITITQQRNLSY